MNWIGFTLKPWKISKSLNVGCTLLDFYQQKFSWFGDRQKRCQWCWWYMCDVNTSSECSLSNETKIVKLIAFNSCQAFMSFLINLINQSLYFCQTHFRVILCVAYEPEFPSMLQSAWGYSLILSIVYFLYHPSFSF